MFLAIYVFGLLIKSVGEWSNIIYLEFYERMMKTIMLGIIFLNNRIHVIFFTLRSPVLLLPSPSPFFSGAGLCYEAGDPMSYTGHLSVGISGDPCLPWTQSGFMDEDFPDGSVVAASNFCRNPHNFHVGPWCKTDEEPFDYCDVLWCSVTGWYYILLLSLK